MDLILSKAERNFTNYDYVDIAEGVATVEYYGGNIDAGLPSTSYVLSRNQFNSHDYTIGASLVDTGDLTDKVFGMTFKYPRIVDGMIIVNASVYGNVTIGTTNIDVTVKAKKNSTVLASVSVESALNFVAPGAIGLRISKGLSISRTKFGPGDVLGIEIILNNATSCTGAVTLLADPANRTDTELSSGLATRMSVYIPFVPEL